MSAVRRSAARAMAAALVMMMVRVRALALRAARWSACLGGAGIMERRDWTRGESAWRA